MLNKSPNSLFVDCFDKKRRNKNDSQIMLKRLTFVRIFQKEGIVSHYDVIKSIKKHTKSDFEEPNLEMIKQGIKKDNLLDEQTFFDQFSPRIK